MLLLELAGWTRAGESMAGTPLWRDPQAPGASPKHTQAAVALQLRRDAGPPQPHPEYVRTADLPATNVHTLKLQWPTRRYDGAVVAMTVVVEAEAVPWLVLKMGLTADDLYAPTSGAIANRPAIILGDARILGASPDGALDYGPEPAYALPAVAELTRAFAAPRRLATTKELREAEAKAEREEKMRREAERQAAFKVAEAARDEAVRRNSPMARIRELERVIAEFTGTRPPAPPTP
jgi:hypothetical protein